MVTSRSLVLLVSLLSFTNALNDWSRPCLAGTCSYDLPDTDGQSESGSIRIWSDNANLITDITTAADWEIIGCDSGKLSQDIRMVCKTESSDKCSHFLDGGAEGKIVRLPQNCGANAFARVSRTWIPEDQSIPSNIARRLVRRAGVPAQVRAVAIDTDFGAVDASKGKIKFALRGANFPGAKGNIEAGQTADDRRRDLMRRFGFGDIVSGVKDAASSVANAAENAAGAVVDAGKTAANAVANTASNAVDTVTDFGSDVFDEAKDVASDVVDVADDAVDEVKEVATKAASVVKSAATKAATAVKSVATKAATAAKDAATKAASAVKSAATKAASEVKDAAKDVVDKAEDLGEKIVDAGKDGLDAVGDGAKKAIDFTDKVVGELNDVSVDKTQALPPISVNKKFNLLDQKVSCPGRSAGLTIDVNANAKLQVTVGIVAAGTIVPPNFEDFAITTTLDGDINSSIDMKAAVSGTLDSGKIQIFQTGIPGFSLPGILTIGPSFRIEGQAVATFDLNVDLNVGVSYKIEKVQAIFPPRDGDKVGTFSIGDTPLKLSASPSVAARGEVAAHLIPALTLGIDALGGKAKADAFINLDASAHAVLTLEASAEASATINTTGKRRSGTSRLEIEGRQESASTSKAATTSAKEDDVATTSTASSAKFTTSAAKGNATATASASAAANSTAAAKGPNTIKTSGKAGFGGCFDVFAQLSVNAGVEGSLFGIFDAKKNFPLFDKKFDLFKKCFGNQARRALPALLMDARSYRSLNAHRRMSKVSRSLRSVEARALGCPKADVAAAASVVDSANAAAAAA